MIAESAIKNLNFLSSFMTLLIMIELHYYNKSYYYYPHDS